MKQRIEKQQKKIDKSKNWFFEKVNRINQLLARLRAKEKKTQINEREDITSDVTEIKKYHKRLL